MVKKLWSLEVVKDKMDNHHLGRLNLASEGPLCQEDQKHHSSPSLFIRAAQLSFFNIGFPHKISFEERDLLKKKKKKKNTLKSLNYLTFVTITSSEILQYLILFDVF